MGHVYALVHVLCKVVNCTGYLSIHLHHYKELLISLC